MAILQKRAIVKCNRMGKPIILTRIVDTMVQAPRCTRAEATDVANAVSQQPPSNSPAPLRSTRLVPVGRTRHGTPLFLGAAARRALWQRCCTASDITHWVPAAHAVHTAHASHAALPGGAQVLDGADGVMLGAETLRGLYPVVTAQTVLKVFHYMHASAMGSGRGAGGAAAHVCREDLAGPAEAAATWLCRAPPGRCSL